MTEAADAVMRYAFHTIGLHKVTVGCISDNVASRRVIADFACPDPECT